MTAKNSLPLAGLSLDLDNQWSYMKIHGDAGWSQYPSYYDICVPRILDLLDRQALKITFFIVGRDVELKKNEEALRQIVARGHELGNHSYSHEPWFLSYSRDRVEREILQADRLIFEVTGQKPVGFRGPGFTWNRNLFDILLNHGYLYDASTLPMYLGPLARMYYFWSSRLTEEEKRQRRDLYGKFRDGRRPVRPFFWHLPSGKSFLEIPVTTMPLLKIPFHLSYLLYLSRFSESLMLLFLKTAAALCRRTGAGLSFLLHPLDFIGGEQVSALQFFPGMDLPRVHKERIFTKVIDVLSRHFRFVNMSAYAGAALDNGKPKRLCVP